MGAFSAEDFDLTRLQARITAAIQSGSGADVIQMLWNWPHLYASGLVDVSDVAEPIGRAQGGYYDVFTSTAKVGGRWLAVPHGTGGNAIAYRRSWHAELGVKAFPKTWDEWREVGKKLKAKGKPVGQALGHSFGDPPIKYPKAVAALTTDQERLLTLLDYPAHWKHLRTTNPIESTFATVRLREPVTKGAGSRTAGLTMAFKLLEAAQGHWRRLDGAELLPPVRAGVRFADGMRVERHEKRQKGAA